MRYQQYWRQCAAVLVLCVTALANAQETHIVKSGEPHADIVIDAEAPPMVRLAAQDLQLHVAKMTGATLPIVTEPTAAIHIYVGQSGYTESLGIAVHVSTPARMRPTTCKVDRSGHCVKATRRQGATISSWKWH